jgi:hypothetical protein
VSYESALNLEGREDIVRQSQARRQRGSCESVPRPDFGGSPESRLQTERRRKILRANPRRRTEKIFGANPRPTVEEVLGANPRRRTEGLESLPQARRQRKSQEPTLGGRPEGKVSF